jgi:PASTA domain
MAPSSEPRKGLNLAKPGMKEYLLIGGAALGLALLYLRLHRKAPAAAKPAAAAAAPTTPTGFSTADFWTWLHDHNFSSTTTSTTTTTTEEPEPKAKPRVSVPDVRGRTFEAGSKVVRDAGLHARVVRKGGVDAIRSESPHAGARVAKGTTVTLTGGGRGGAK